MKTPQSPPSLQELIAELDDVNTIRRLLSSPGHAVDSMGRYLHWDEMRNHKPPDGLTHREWWLSTSWARQSIARPLPLLSVDGKQFQFSNVDAVQEMVHCIDQQASGQIVAGDVVINLQSTDRYLISSLVEEAITSSQLEGASTTRRVAKEMLATGRKPRDHSEQMIANNFKAMVVAHDLAHEALIPDSVLNLHSIITEETLDPSHCGRLQTDNDKRIAVYWQDGTLLHQPPPASELPDRLVEMCRFANGETPDGFIHPVVRAVILHFWLAYDHPFEDGNGRTARALFYWAMLHYDYWLTQYLSVSAILHKAPAKYARSFLLTETDNFDITYFVIYQLKVIERAIKSLYEYLARKIEETREIEQMLRGSGRLNQRQLLVIRDALRDPGEPFTIAAQARRNSVVNQTARTDLLDLEDLGLLLRVQMGKKYVFRSPRDLAERLRKLGADEAQIRHARNPGAAAFAQK
jgi:Fic family protein